MSWEDRFEIRKQKGATNSSREQLSDFDVAGLQRAALVIAALPQGQAEARCIALWGVLLDTLREARDTFFRGTYHWEYFHSAWDETFPAQFVRNLRSVRWIVTAKRSMAAAQEMCFSEAAESIRAMANPILQELLGFRPEAILQLAEETGVELEAIELLKKHGLTGDTLRDVLRKVGLEQQKVTTPEPQVAEPPHPPAPPQPTPQGGGGAGKEVGVEVAGAVASILGTDHPSPTPPVVSAGPDEYPRGGHGPSLGLPTGTKHGDSHPGVPGNTTQQSRFFSYVYVSPNGEGESGQSIDPEEHFRREKVGRDGVDYVKEQEARVGIEVVEMSQTHEGYDIELRNSSGEVERYIEVKATGKSWGDRGVTLSEPQLRDARRFKEKYWLYVVENAGQPDCKLFRIQDPASKIDNYVFDGGWKVAAIE